MRIYISGVGVGTGPLAFIARDMGHDVVCSDIAESDTVRYLKDKDFTVHIGQDGNALQKEHAKQPIDKLIYSAAVPEDNAELEAARAMGIPTMKRDGFIVEMLAEKELKMIAVSGTHGKTGTTAMIAWSMLQAGMNISYSIGGTVSFGEFGQYSPGSKYFVYEADEYDRNMLKFNPDIAVVTNVDFDHPDTYGNKAAYDEAFVRFQEQSRVLYGYQEDFPSSAISKDAKETSTTLPGIYHRQNARLAIEMLVNEFNLPKAGVVEWVNNFPGVGRRMEKISDGLYSDYAHHPDEIRATLRIAKELNHKVIAVYQPHQNVRQHAIRREYEDCFAEADKVYWLPTYLSREDPSLPIISPSQLVEGLDDPNKVELAQMGSNLVEAIKIHLRSGHLVVAMSAGDLDHWIRSSI